MALAALLGGLYAVLAYFPGWAFLSRPACQAAAAAAMALLAFGSSKRLLRVSLMFLALAATFGGGVLCLQLLSGGGPVLDLKTVLLSAAACYVLVPLVFHRTARHGGRELAVAQVSLGERTCRLTALVDTGNTLTDPVTGKTVMVCEGERLAGLFPAGECPTPDELRDPAGALERRGAGWRLLPYRAVGVSCGLLLAVKADRVTVGEEDYGAILVALSPTPVSDGGGYHALIGA